MIVCFSCTGNSAWCAKLLAQRLDDEVVDVFHYIRNGIAADLVSGRPWVFVVPTYAWRLPRVFEQFLRSGSFQGSEDAYFVMTCGQEMGNAPRYIRPLCGELGLRCRGTLEVVMPENYIALFDAPGEVEARSIVEAARPVLERGAALIRAGEDFPEPEVSIADRIKSGIVNPCFYPLIVKAKKFTADDRCISCGKCAQICPLGNIELQGGKPVWGDRCTHCMACICGCPTEAIEYGRATQGKVRYHCPDVKF